MIYAINAPNNNKTFLMCNMNRPMEAANLLDPCCAKTFRLGPNVR